MIQSITSLQNQRIKNLVKLRQRRQRDKQGLMLIDGQRAITCAHHNKFNLDAVYFAPPLSESEVFLLESLQAQGLALFEVSEAVWEKISYGNSPDRLLVTASQPKFGLAELPYHQDALYLITEGIEKPGNLGAMLRSADAAGVTGLIVCDNRTDIYNPNVIRASRGAFFTVPIAISSTKQALDWLAERQVQVLAATPAADSQVYSQVDMHPPTAIALGAEHSGLSDFWLAQTQAVYIPMWGQVDSLNVAQAASILLFEAQRQRQG